MSYRVRVFLSAWFGCAGFATVTVATLESSFGTVFHCNSVEIVLAQSGMSTSIDEINREIEALAADVQRKPIPEDSAQKVAPQR